MQILLTDDSSHYKQRLIDVGNNRLSEVHISQSRYNPGNVTIPQDQVAQLDDYMFMVASQLDPELLYTVEMRYSVVWSILVYSRTKK